MIRDVDLISYLPAFMQVYREPAAALAAENPEFRAVWEAADRLLRNRFISTADGYGLGRLEKILGLSPSDGDSLDLRRSRIQNRWNNQVPATLKALAFRLTEMLGGEHNFSLCPDFDNAYGLLLVVYSTDDKSDVELRYLLESVVPMNIAVEIVYESVTDGLSICCGVIMEQADIVELKQM